ncbi:unnamed protein product [marine sediment metagenome]|uniref:Uncharacterized protein n=1 Tax=marine sediment metagenome TaxID=412755 RepID=X1RHI7_9ZZZZ
MTAAKATEYLDIVLKAHPRLSPGDFGQAVKLGQEALAELVRLRKVIPILKDTLLPGETPEIDTKRSLHHIKEVLESPEVRK